MHVPLNGELQALFYSVLERYAADHLVVQQFWHGIEKAYTASSRHYHNFQHLVDLHSELSSVKSEMDDPEVIWMAMFYHDIVYNTFRTNNEEKSAELASKRLLSISFPIQKTEKCQRLILTTKSHVISEDNDINLFTDADLSILGKSTEKYRQYLLEVRKEYGYFPGFLYYPARKKVLHHFLSMPYIYKTAFFREKYESQARLNISEELRQL